LYEAAEMHWPSPKRTGVPNQIGALLALVQLGVLDLCVVRAAVDLLHGSLGVEGAIALTSAALLTASLARKAACKVDVSMQSLHVVEGRSGSTGLTGANTRDVTASPDVAREMQPRRA
jgi:hypothetical protein